MTVAKRFWQRMEPSNLCLPFIVDISEGRTEDLTEGFDLLFKLNKLSTIPVNMDKQSAS